MAGCPGQVSIEEMVAAQKESTTRIAWQRARQGEGQRRVELPSSGLLTIDGDAGGVEHEQARRRGHAGATCRPSCDRSRVVDERHVENGLLLRKQKRLF